MELVYLLVPDRDGAQRGEAENKAHVEEHLEQHLRHVRVDLFSSVDVGPGAGGFWAARLYRSIKADRQPLASEPRHDTSTRALLLLVNPAQVERWYQ